MKLIKLSLFQETSLAQTNFWYRACLFQALITFAAFGALITFAAFVKFITTNLGIFQLGKAFLLKFLPVCIFCIFFMYMYLELD